MIVSAENSKLTRVEPVFTWLRDEGGNQWPAQILCLVDGLEIPLDPGVHVRTDCVEEVKVPPSARRLAWMIRNADRLTPRDGSHYDDYRKRVIENARRQEALDRLDRGETHGTPRELKLEGPSHADCLIECARAVIWIEGKRNDWLDYSTTWDVTRDQLARNAEAAWLYASARGKDSCVVVCYEHRLKHHEELLIDGYRCGTWIGGWPHLTADERRALGGRIGTLTWGAITSEWPSIAAESRWFEPAEGRL